MPLIVAFDLAIALALLFKVDCSSELAVWLWLIVGILTAPVWGLGLFFLLDWIFSASERWARAIRRARSRS